VSLSIAGVFTNRSFTVGSAVPTDLWLTPDTYTVTASGLPANWTLDTNTTSITAVSQTAPVNATVNINERGENVTISVTNAAGTLVGGARVTLVAPPGITAPAARTTATSGANLGTTTFANLPFGTGWTANVTSGTGAAQLTGTANFDVTSRTAKTVPVTVR
jgi:hypothetical protein